VRGPGLPDYSYSHGYPKEHLPDRRDELDRRNGNSATVMMGSENISPNIENTLSLRRIL
jgi:hypothetical protein